MYQVMAKQLRSPFPKACFTTQLIKKLLSIVAFKEKEDLKRRLMQRSSTTQRISK